ncbi:MAG: MBL fold metallo-hydrolase [Gammaproteobacteria bacterium]|nr:MBL fold metallo-hydrolase [Gammaproteobacteria bacterium]
MQRLLKNVFPALLGLLFTASAAAGQFDDVEIKTTKVADGIYMLAGMGGNIGLLTGPDGNFLIDDQFAPLTDKIRAAVAEVGEGDIRFILNTHYHGDHTGGNENLGSTGSLIIAHENVRKRLSTDEFMQTLRDQGAEDPSAALPVITFNDGINFHINGLTLRGVHIANAHTDGDTMIWFEGANVVHMGDTFFQVGFPFVDVEGGGSLAGMMKAIDHVLAKADSETRIIPGHGELTDVEGLKEYRAMLVDVARRVEKLKAEGNSVDDIVEMDPLADLRERWDWAFINADKLIRAIYPEL